MKKLLLYLVFLSVLTASCNNFLDVSPKGMVIPHTVEEYDKLLNQSQGSITNLLYMNPEVNVPDRFVLELELKNIAGYRWDEFQYKDDENDEDWNSFYARIFVCNEIISNIDQAETITLNEELRKYVKGQAYAERAKCYFALVNLYARHYKTDVLNEMGVPLLLENDISQKKERATIGEVYEQIGEDLRLAEKWVPKSVDSHQRMRACQQGLLAFKAKVHLYKGEFDSAYIAINRAFEQLPKLYRYEEYEREKVTDVFDKSTLPEFVHENEEIIWHCGLHRNFWRWNVFYSDDLLNLFDKENDLRFCFWSTSVDRGGNSYGAYRHTSMVMKSFAASSPEMYLIRAECCARRGEVQKAIDDLNTLREYRYRHGSEYRLSASGPAIALQLVKEERLRELAFTGQNWFDQKRYAAYGENVPVYQRSVNDKLYTLAPDSPRYLCSIPRYVISKNPNIEQNPR